MTKKILGIILFLAMLLNLQVYVLAVDNPAISVSSVSGKCGETVEVSVVLSENRGFSNIALEFGYDSSAMRLVSVVENPSVNATCSKAEFQNKNPYNMSWFSDRNNTFNGTLVTLKFEITTAKSGEYPVTVDYFKGRNSTYIDGYDVNYDENFTSLNLQYSSGKVIVSETAEYIPVKIVAGDKNFTVNLPGKVSDGGEVFAAMYDEKGRMKSVKRQNVSSDNEINFATYGKGFIKVMWWQDLNSLKPMCISASLTL